MELSTARQTLSEKLDENVALLKKAETLKQALETQKAAIAAGNFPLTEAVGRHTHTNLE